MTSDTSPMLLTDAALADPAARDHVLQYLATITDAIRSGALHVDAIGIVVQFRGLPEFVGWAGTHSWDQRMELARALSDEVWARRWKGDGLDRRDARASAENRRKMAHIEAARKDDHEREFPWVCACQWRGKTSRGLDMHVSRAFDRGREHARVGYRSPDTVPVLRLVTEAPA